MRGEQQEDFEVMGWLLVVKEVVQLPFLMVNLRHLHMQGVVMEGVLNEWEEVIVPLMWLFCYSYSRVGYVYLLGWEWRQLGSWVCMMVLLYLVIVS